MKISKIILVSSFSVFCLIKAQTQVVNTDSIDKVLKTLKEDTAKVNLLIKTGRTQLTTLPDKAFNYCQQAIALSKIIDYPLGLANAYCLKGHYFLQIKNETKMAFSNFQLADSIYHKYKGRNYTLGIGTILYNYGVIQHMQGNYLEAAQFYIGSSKIFDSLNEKTYLPKLYCNLSSLYSYIRQNDKAEFYARQAIKLAEETSDFCSEISNPAIKIDFRFYGENKPIDQKIEISAFRIIQELVNNALKHSEASQIVVQIMQEAERLSVSVQDNGKGFDPKIIDTNKSVGLSSIKSRVFTHNGIIDINTEIGKGTEIQVEFGI
jgi:tetratricopeptide (TPR) repeat protein